MTEQPDWRILVEGVRMRVDGRELYGEEGLTLDVVPGKVLALVGPSGSGKSTLVRLLLGLSQAHRGQINLQRDNLVVPMGLRSGLTCGVVFQDSSLFPNKSAFDNIRFPLQVGPAASRVSKGEQRNAVLAAAEQVSLPLSLLEKKPRELSGGEQQRVAIARAIVVRRDLYIFDEPFAGLDNRIRWELNALVQRLANDLRERHDASFIFVTHHQDDAMSLATTIAVLESGRGIAQIGSPAEVYEKPASAFVARVIGEAPVNRVAFKLLDKQRQVYALPGELRGTTFVLSLKDHGNGAEPSLAFRAEHARVHLVRPSVVGGVIFEGVIRQVRYEGVRQICTIDASGCLLYAVGSEAGMVPSSSTVWVTVPMERLMLFDSGLHGDPQRQGCRLEGWSAVEAVTQ